MFLMMPRRMTDFMHIGRKVSVLLVSVKTKKSPQGYSVYLFSLLLSFILDVAWH